tara:strand:- start:62 stop:223 length:162 start_codon:yes stop_codon:yes gene_type:complete
MFTCERCGKIVKVTSRYQKCGRCCRLLKEKGISPSKWKRGEKRMNDKNKEMIN